MSKTKYIFSNGTLKRKDFSIAFRNEENKSWVYIPIENTREVMCFGKVNCNNDFLDFMGKTGIVIHFFNYYGHYTGSFYPRNYLLSGKLLVKQVEAYKTKREKIAKNIILGIAENIEFVLYHYYRHGNNEVYETIEIIRNLKKLLINNDYKIKELLMIEGNIWYEFYNSFKYFLNDDFVFNKRVKRPPDNPLNAMISFGNSILYTKTISQIYHTHLDQRISFLHEPSEARFSLSLDLAEVFKPIIVFKTIFDLINNRKINVLNHFEKKYNYCILNDEGRKIFILALEKRLNNVVKHPILKRNVSYLTLIKIDGYKLIKEIMENKEFIPYIERELK